MQKQLILASKSLRRVDLLTRAGFTFEVVESDYEETPFSLDPILTAKTFALGKAKAVFSKLKNKQNQVVLGADTVVVLDDKILGKPRDNDDAKMMLKSLSGKSHSVITAYAIITENESVVDSEKTKVIFNDLSDELIEKYIASKLPFGKAGSYGIQDGYPLVKEYCGSLNNVIGLPTEKIVPLLKKLLNKN